MRNTKNVLGEKEKQSEREKKKRGRQKMEGA